MDEADLFMARARAENLARAQDAAGCFVAKTDPEGTVTYYNLATAESVAFHSDRCEVVFPSGTRAEFKTAKETQLIRRLVDRETDR
jgi:hypothetical protein